MNYKKIVIFTKTDWNEPPRLRHQLTNLLINNGHKIIYFEKTSTKQLKIKENSNQNIKFLKHFELFHHQLKPFNLMVKLNAFLNKMIIKKILRSDEFDLIVNFNYDYYFLKEIYPNKKIITIINDDFEAQSKFWMKKSITKQLEDTIKISDLVLTVSFPLLNRLKEVNKKTKLFLPWASKKYETPTKNEYRDVVLYWGYIDERLNYDIVEFLLVKNIKIRFIGNISKNSSPIIKRFIKKYKNFKYTSSQQIDEVYFDDICCSILPYYTSNNSNRATTISNRAFQLLSYGIPLVYSNLPHLLKVSKNVINKCDNENEFLNSIKYFEDNFFNVQKEIEDLLENNYDFNRYKTLLDEIGLLDD